MKTLPVIARLAALVASLGCPVLAADRKPAPGTTDDLPQPVDLNVARTMLESPPFTRALNLSDSLVLTGIAYIQGKPVATILDKAKKTTYIVSEEPNAMGWKLAEASTGASLTRTTAKILVGNEVVTVRFGAEQMSPDDGKKGSRPAGPGGPPPPDGDRPRREYPRPSEDDRRRFESLSDKAKDKVREFFRENREKLMNATPEERMAFIKSNFERIAKEDAGGK